MKRISIGIIVCVGVLVCVTAFQRMPPKVQRFYEPDIRESRMTLNDYVRLLNVFPGNATAAREELQKLARPLVCSSDGEGMPRLKYVVLTGTQINDLYKLLPVNAVQARAATQRMNIGPLASVKCFSKREWKEEMLPHLRNLPGEFQFVHRCASDTAGEIRVGPHGVIEALEEMIKHSKLYYAPASASRRLDDLAATGMPEQTHSVESLDREQQ